MNIFDLYAIKEYYENDRSVIDMESERSILLVDHGECKCGNCGKSFSWEYFKENNIGKDSSYPPRHLFHQESAAHIQSYSSDGKFRHARINCPYCHFDNFLYETIE